MIRNIGIKFLSWTYMYTTLTVFGEYVILKKSVLF